MRTVKATRILTMLRGASELDRVGQFQTADFLLDLARQSMQRVAYEYDYRDYRPEASAEMQEYMRKHPDYFGFEIPLGWDAKTIGYSSLQYDDVDKAYHYAQRTDPDAIERLSPSELRHWYYRSKSGLKPDTSTWSHITNSGLERGSPAYDYYLKLTAHDPVYDQVDARMITDYLQQKHEGTGIYNWSNRHDYNVNKALLKAANNYLIHGTFEPDRTRLDYWNPLTEEKLRNLRGLQSVMDRDGASEGLPATPAARIGDGSVANFHKGRPERIFEQFNAEEDEQLPYDALIARSILDNNRERGNEKLNDLRSKMEKIYRVTPESYPGYYDLLKALALYPHLMGTSLAVLQEIIGHLKDYKDYGNDIAKLMTVFNKNWKAWAAKFGNDPHVAAQVLPEGTARELRGLGDFLMRWNGKYSTTDLYTIASYWKNLSDEERALPPKELADLVHRHKLQEIFQNEDISHVPFAVEAARWWQDTLDEAEEEGQDIEDLEAISYADLEELFLNSQSVPLPEWASVTAEAGGLRGRFLPRSDVRGLFLGQYSNSCQHPWGAGKDCALHGQQSPFGAFFVVEDQNGDIVAQSWVWEDRDGDIVFDNVEAMGIGPKRMPLVQKIYQDVAKQMKGRIVNIGEGGSDMNLDPFPKAYQSLVPFDYKGYRDSKNQRMLADNTSGEPD